MTDDSLWGAMERLRLSTIAGVDRLEAMVADAREAEDRAALGGDQS